MKSETQRISILEVGRRATCLEDVVRATQLPVLLLKRGDPLPVSGRGSPAATGVDLRLANPVPQRLGADAELAGDTRDHTVLLAALLADLEHHPHRALAQLLRILLRPTPLPIR